MAVADNSGAWNVKVIGAKLRGKNPRNVVPGDRVIVVGRRGGAKNRVMRAVVVRMRKQSHSPTRNGFSLTFDQNACVMSTKGGNPVGSKVNGPIDSRVGLRWPKIQALVRN
eukprot:CAMPEP_0171091480 /NCGR_PEP_ID=MMETSP0766_2-20121228/33559_1 /TAXON_ID=439317 /ORGANISM="Gambierdiscus australes, Strain CAWD 149" /LENGTH=110 /DNA_ID=CAMNT_0011549591 /DNA_START=201 /DNA_END=533 /DNA_ORIENTATION=+